MNLDEPDVLLSVATRNRHVSVEDVSDNRLPMVLATFHRTTAVLCQSLRSTANVTVGVARSHCDWVDLVPTGIVAEVLFDFLCCCRV